MVNWRFADDSSSYIAYSGSWTRQIGSDRQWNTGISFTFQVGATATFRFRGTAVRVYGTVPAGSGSVQTIYRVGNGRPISVDRPCGSAIAYFQPFFDQQNLDESDHMLVITNVGSEADFRLDRVDWLPIASDIAGSETPLPPQNPGVASPPVSEAPTALPETAPPHGPDSMPPTAAPPTVAPTVRVTTTRPNANPSSDPATSVRPGTGIETVTRAEAAVSTFVDGDKLLVTVVSPLSTHLSVSTNANGKEVTATMILTADGSTTTVEANSTSTAGAKPGGIADRLSKGVLVGIIIGSLAFLLVLSILLGWLRGRARRRQRLLENLTSNSPYAWEPKRGRGRTGSAHCTPFHLTDRSLSSEGLPTASGSGRRVRLALRTSSVHKSSINHTTDAGPISENDNSGPSLISPIRVQNVDIAPSSAEGGSNVSQGPSRALHRRRPTTVLDGNTPFATFLVPPPAYELCVDVSTSGRELALVVPGYA